MKADMKAKFIMRIIRSAVPIIIVLYTVAPCRSEQYSLGYGDVLEFSIIAAPELKHRGSISLEGTLILPLAGEIKAAGLSISDLRADVLRRIPNTILRRRTPDGNEYPIVISPEEITIDVVEYRPIYVNGDVSKPGSIPYRAGMIVRQAVALAGGYDIMRFRMNSPFLENADLRSEYESQWTEFAKERVAALRLRAELASQSDIQGDAIKGVPIPATVADQIFSTEKERLSARNSNFENEKTHLRNAIKYEDSRIATLTEQLKQENEGTEADTEEYERVRDLLKKGSVPITRVTELRRLILLSSTRALQTQAQLEQVMREKQELGRKLQRVDDERRVDILKELQDTEVRLASITARLRAVGEKLIYTGMVKSQLVRGKGAEPEIIVFRSGQSDQKDLVAGQDTKLLPGDVVEVSLRSTMMPEQYQN